jgi:hypothetical protein
MSVAGAVGFFVSFVVRNGIVERLITYDDDEDED